MVNPNLDHCDHIYDFLRQEESFDNPNGDRTIRIIHDVFFCIKCLEYTRIKAEKIHLAQLTPGRIVRETVERFC